FVFWGLGWVVCFGWLLWFFCFFDVFCVCLGWGWGCVVVCFFCLVYCGFCIVGVFLFVWFVVVCLGVVGVGVGFVVGVFCLVLCCFWFWCCCLGGWWWGLVGGVFGGVWFVCCCIACCCFVGWFVCWLGLGVCVLWVWWWCFGGVVVFVGLVSVVGVVVGVLGRVGVLLVGVVFGVLVVLCGCWCVCFWCVGGGGCWFLVVGVWGCWVCWFCLVAWCWAVSWFWRGWWSFCSILHFCACVFCWGFFSYFMLGARKTRPSPSRP
ncbi:hypothetical protein RA272_27485, partial [Pseudomonas syringae pv. tagetis]